MDQEIKILINDGKNVFKSWKKGLWIVVVMSIIGFMLGCMLTLYPNPNQYTATSTVYSYTIYGKDLSAYSQLIKTSRICGKAAELINDDYITQEKIKNMIDISYSSSSLIIYINAHSESEDEAIIVANAVANAFVNDINNQKGNYTVNILDKANVAYLYTEGFKQQWLIRIAACIAFGIVTMLILAIKSLISKDIMVTEDFTCGGKLQILGVIPKYFKN